MTEPDETQRTLEENKALVRRLFDVFASRTTDLEGATAELLAPDFVHRFDTNHAFDRARYLAAVGVFYRAFPDLEYRSRTSSRNTTG